MTAIASAPGRPAAQAGLGESILVVDDDPFIRKLVATTLADVGGFAVTGAADGVEALERADELEPRVVLLDVDMPRMDGVEACRALRERRWATRTRIVMLTASPEHARSARIAGADLFLVKPFSPLELLKLVDELR